MTLRWPWVRRARLADLAAELEDERRVSRLLALLADDGDLEGLRRLVHDDREEAAQTRLQLVHSDIEAS